MEDKYIVTLVGELILGFLLFIFLVSSCERHNMNVKGTEYGKDPLTRCLDKLIK